MGEDWKRREYVYRNRAHLTLLDARERKYCRMANAILPFSVRRCENCPLWSGDCREVACMYYDLDGPTENRSTMEAKRTQGMMALGYTGEFPEFVDGSSRWPAEADVYERALQFAAAAHKGAYRKGTKIPYIVHPVEVSMIVLGMLWEEKQRLKLEDYSILAAAALHDVVEDTKYTAQDIRANFSARIEALVAYETEDKHREMAADSWRMRKEEFLKHLCGAPREAMMIALGDKLSNLRDLAEDLRASGPEVWSKFNQKDPAAHEWYYRSVASALKGFSESKYYAEYNALCNEVFGMR